MTTFNILVAFAGAAGVSWLVLLVRKSIRDASYPVPPALLCIWVGWDGPALAGKIRPLGAEYVFQPAFLALEAAFFWLAWKYREPRNPPLSGPLMTLLCVLGIAGSVTAIWWINTALDDPMGASTALLVTAATPITMLILLRARRSARGQSLPASLLFLAGTIALTLALVNAPAELVPPGNWPVNLSIGALATLTSIWHITELTRLNTSAEVDLDQAA
ncbi:hypothetical protein [Streptomyces sp. NRRL S-237]|uniref:transmembrane-type terpene cyclase n=1 Tax=Streptomyces sp. NRRL S-237 TaxID=1463895 RepID=UPI0004CBC20D|nr:hypothetical protein [Streptomyces sp. NRRL S-237]